MGFIGIERQKTYCKPRIISSSKTCYTTQTLKSGKQGNRRKSNVETRQFSSVTSVPMIKGWEIDWCRHNLRHFMDKMVALRLEPITPQEKVEDIVSCHRKQKGKRKNLKEDKCSSVKIKIFSFILHLPVTNLIKNVKYSHLIIWPPNLNLCTHQVSTVLHGIQ